jgi:hypothetical protein
MGEMRPKHVLVEDGLDKPRHLVFSLNALEAVEDKFGNEEDPGGLETIWRKVKDQSSFSALKWLLYQLILWDYMADAEDGALYPDEDPPTLDQFGAVIDVGAIGRLQNSVGQALDAGAPEGDGLGKAEAEAAEAVQMPPTGPPSTTSDEPSLD